ncbi:MAG TPA: toll/interleukin-1 receptor domain-containing protein [Pyrinomonadaceae bacterium]|nr:toll/interleukin-1 receptor domain-containing protein [Pyrinomonadaceae bacterium]
MALLFNGAWRFVPPPDGKFRNSSIPTSALNECLDLIRKVSTQGDLQDVLEHFKGYFCRALGTAHVQSSSIGWTETDLRSYMEQAAENAPLFIEAMVEACRAASRLGENFYAPDSSAINILLAKHDVGYEVIGEELVLRETPTSGQLSEWYDKLCTRCGARIRVHRDWENPPSQCKSCSRTSVRGHHSSIRAQVESLVATTSRSLRVFLCHSSGDKSAVRDLYNRLLQDGIDPWLDEEKLLPGQDWQREIPRAVRDCDVVIVCLSRGSISKKGYIQKEIKYALDVADEQPEGAIFIIPLKLEDCETPERLCRWQWVSLLEENGYMRLMRALQARAKTLDTAVTPEN